MERSRGRRKSLFIRGDTAIFCAALTITTEFELPDSDYYSMIHSIIHTTLSILTSTIHTIHFDNVIVSIFASKHKDSSSIHVSGIQINVLFTL